MLVSLENAGVRRSDKWLVRGVSMAVEAGEIVTFIGPNGSGKTTTAKLVLGILKPDEGRVQQKPNLRVSYVPQQLAGELDPAAYSEPGFCTHQPGQHGTGSGRSGRD